MKEVGDFLEQVGEEEEGEELKSWPRICTLPRPPVDPALMQYFREHAAKNYPDWEEFIDNYEDSDTPSAHTPTGLLSPSPSPSNDGPHGGLQNIPTTPAIMTQEDTNMTSTPETFSSSSARHSFHPRQRQQNPSTVSMTTRSRAGNKTAFFALDTRGRSKRVRGKTRYFYHLAPRMRYSTDYNPTEMPLLSLSSTRSGHITRRHGKGKKTRKVS